MYLRAFPFYKPFWKSPKGFPRLGNFQAPLRAAVAALSLTCNCRQRPVASVSSKLVKVLSSRQASLQRAAWPSRGSPAHASFPLCVVASDDDDDDNDDGDDACARIFHYDTHLLRCVS